MSMVSYQLSVTSYQLPVTSIQLPVTMSLTSSWKLATGNWQLVSPQCNERLQGVADLLGQRADVEERERRIELARRAAYRSRERRRIPGRPHVQRGLRRVVLRQRLVDEVLRVLGDAVVLAVLRHADHGG